VPLIPFLPATTGTVLTPEIFNEIAKPVFDDQPQFFGHNARIADTDLSNAAGQIKQRVANLDLNLKVSAGTGLNVTYSSGIALYGQTLFNIVSGTLAILPSTTNYVYVDIAGVVRTTNQLGSVPIVRAMLAQVVTNVTGVTNVFDVRQGYKIEIIQPFNVSVRNFGGRGEQGAFVAAGGEVLGAGEYFYTDFTVAAGRTITVSKLARIYCTGNMTIAGIVNVTPASQGGGGFTFTISGNARLPGNDAVGAGAASGESAGTTYSHVQSLVGSGGAGGSVTQVGIPRTGTTFAGGDGGGCFSAEVAGNITISGSIIANGTSGTAAATQGSVNTDCIAYGASSGGSGGLILLKSLGLTSVSGTLSVVGGNGGNGIVDVGGAGAESGCGGGGGRIVIYSPAINTTGSTLNLNGGAAGSGAQPTATIIALNGGGGSFGGTGGSAASFVGQPGTIGQTSLFYAISAG
jgi:hypothetical protein